MKKKDLDELKVKSAGELTKKIAELEKTKINVQIEAKMAKSKNVHELAKIKKDIAQAKTIKRIKQMAQIMETEKLNKKEAVNAAN